MERRLAAILAADVVGYSRLVGEDEEGTLRTLGACREVIDGLVTEHRGRVFGSAGDSVVAEFASPVEAVRCAADIQRDLERRNADLPEDRQMRFRIGINLGDVIVEGDNLLGDGVNVAARLETLANAGGICLSQPVFDQIKNKLELGYEYLGEHAVKNIADPVRVYRVLLEPDASGTVIGEAKRAKQPWKRVVVAAVVVVLIGVAGAALWLKPWGPREEPASIQRMAHPLPDKPSIAVLPFANMSDDPKQEYFVDGITEDLITDLSKLSGLFVISRNSTFTYKGKTVTIRQVAEELGVRYVLEGSVRRVGDEVRINAQLIDATTGGHVWAERYDSSLTDVFALQDKVTQNIVTALAVNLTAGEQVQQARKETDSPEAYDAFLRGWAHYVLHTPDDFAKAIPYLENAVELDPTYGRAHAALAAIYWEGYDSLWAKSLGLSSNEAYDKARRHLEEALKDPTPLAHRIVAKMHGTGGRWDEAMAEAERAIALDANDPNGYVAMSILLVDVGRPAEGLEFIETAMRLDPQSDYLYRLGEAQFHLERYDEAAATLLRAAKRNPSDEWNFFLLAAAYGQLGREQEARSAIETFNNMRLKAQAQLPHS